MNSLYNEIEYYKAEIAESLAEIEKYQNFINDCQGIIEALYKLQAKNESEAAV